MLNFIRKLEKYANSNDWRTRLKYSDIISQIHKHYEVSIVKEKLFPLWKIFLYDVVSEVRIRTAENSSEMLSRILNSKFYMLEIREFFKKLVEESSYHYRKLFFIVMKNAFFYISQVEEANYYLKLIVDALKEKVYNCKIKLLELVMEIISKIKKSFDFQINEEEKKSSNFLLLKNENSEESNFQNTLPLIATVKKKILLENLDINQFINYLTSLFLFLESQQLKLII